MTTNWTSPNKSRSENYLLKEDGGIILQQNGDKIMLEADDITWGNINKNTPTWGEVLTSELLFFFNIDDTYQFLIDNTYKLGIGHDWTSPVKN